MLLPHTKKLVSIKLDSDVLAYFQAAGRLASATRLAMQSKD
ncbi:BrnA antitoxin family protein [Rhizobium sp. LjRoot254]